MQMFDFFRLLSENTVLKTPLSESLSTLTLTRRAFLGLCTAAGVAVSGAAAHLRYFEPGNFELTKRTLPLPGGPYGGRLLHISDFHASDEINLSLLQRAIALIEKIQPPPHAILVTGDLITNRLLQPEPLLQEMRRLARIAPCFVTFGNHDGGRWAGFAYQGYPDTNFLEDLCLQAGAQPLINRRTHLDLPAGRVILAGLGDLWSGKMRPEKTLKTSADSHPVVLLSHNPDSKDSLKHWHWDAMLCGHTHGGQCVIPLIGWRPVLPVRDKRFVEGLYNWHGRRLYITRGIGALHGIRFNCRPELTLLEV